MRVRMFGIFAVALACAAGACSKKDDSKKDDKKSSSISPEDACDHVLDDVMKDKLKGMPAAKKKELKAGCVKDAKKQLKSDPDGYAKCADCLMSADDEKTLNKKCKTICDDKDKKKADDDDDDAPKKKKGDDDDDDDDKGKKKKGDDDDDDN